MAPQGAPAIGGALAEPHGRYLGTAKPVHCDTNDSTSALSSITLSVGLPEP